MAQTSRTALQTLINSTIYTNVTNDITGDEVNDVCTDLNDSAVNWVTDIEQVLTNAANKVPSSAAVFNNAPIKTFLTNANYTTARNANQLRPYHWYLVTAAFADNIWGYAWGALVMATTNNTILKTGYAFIIQSSPTYIGQLIPIQMVDDTLNWGNGIYLGNANDEKMVLSSADAASYNTAGVKRFMGDTSVIVEVTDIFGNVIPLRCKVDNAGTSIQNIGYSNDAVAGAYEIDFVNDLAWPLGTVNAKLTLTSTELIAGGSYVLINASPPANYFWSILSASYQYEHGTTAYTGGLQVGVNATGIGSVAYITNADFASATSNYIAIMTENNDIEDINQYDIGSKVNAEVVTVGVGGDGDITVYVTAQLVQA